MQSTETWQLDSTCKPEVVPFFDEDTNTFSYVVRDPGSVACAVVDSVLDIDYAAGRLSTGGADKIIDYIRQQKLDLQWIIETHVHADHLSAAPYIQEALGGKIGIGNQITTVQEVFGKVFNADTRFARDGSQFDRLFADGDSYQVGGMLCHALHTPGHTPACMVHVMGDAVFVGDTLFCGSIGRTDLPGGDHQLLIRGIREKLFPFADDTRVYPGHGPATTIGREKQNNPFLG
jgi:glyoxylase-like metal-dependent hydrolase (beta-lactamase superfamily II)